MSIEIDPCELLHAERLARRVRLARELGDLWLARERGEDVEGRETRFDAEFNDLVADVRADQLVRRLMRATR